MEENGGCSADLAELRNALARELEDEITASSKYREAAVKLYHYGETAMGKTLGMMSQDEFNHYMNLIDVIKALNNHCGRSRGNVNKPGHSS